LTTDPTTPARKPRKWLLTQNHELREVGAFNWTLPAFVVELSDGSHFNVCPSAGVCASVCYARNGTFNFPGVKQAHRDKLEWVLNDLPGWMETMKAEVAHKRYQGKHVRIHDSGDFFSDEYLMAWLEIARSAPGVTFYCYTKEVDRFRRIVENRDGDHPDLVPPNFRYLFSYGGKQDRALDEDVDRVADIFPSFEAMEEAGYTSQHTSDLLAIYNENNRVGIPYNNIPHFKKKIKGRTFQQMQRERDERLETRGLPAEERDAALRQLTLDAEKAALCECGNPFAGPPAPDCHRWGHAVSRSADVTDRVYREEGKAMPIEETVE
jgi:hypothetical protein